LTPTLLSVLVTPVLLETLETKFDARWTLAAPEFTARVPAALAPL